MVIKKNSHQHVNSHKLLNYRDFILKISSRKEKNFSSKTYSQKMMKSLLHIGWT